MKRAAPLTQAPNIDGLAMKLNDDGRLAVTYNPGDLPAGAVLAKLQAAGIEIRDLDTQGAELENVFMKLTS